MEHNSDHTNAQLRLFLFFSAVFLAAIAVLSTAESSALTTAFAHHDQYRYFAETLLNPRIKQICGADRQYYWLWKIGRPLSAELECLVFRHVSTLPDLTPFRRFTILIQSLSAAILALALQRADVSPVPAGSLAISVFLLPGAANTIFMANLPNAITPILAIGSHMLLDIGVDNFSESRVSPTRVATVGAAWILLTIAFNLFVGLAVFFFTTTFVDLYFRKSGNRSRILLRDIVFFLSVALPYYLILTRIYEPTFAIGQRIPRGYHAILSVSGLFIGAIKVLLFTLITLNLWNIYPRHVITAVIFLVCLLGSLLRQTRKAEEDGETSGQRSDGWLMLLATFAAANVVVAASTVSVVYRVLLAQSAILIFVVFGSIAAIAARCLGSSVQKAENTAAIFLLGVGAIFCGFTTSENVIASVLERAYLRATIANVQRNSFDEIALVQPRFDKSGRGNIGLNGLPIIGDEFNMPTTVGSKNLGSDVPDMVRSVLIELGRHERPVFDGSLPIRQQGEGYSKVLPGGFLEIEAPNGWSARGRINGEFIVMPMGLIGTISKNDERITWNAGVIWQKHGAGLNGRWRSDLSGEGVVVFRFPAGSTPPSSPRVLVVDMKKAAFN